MIKAIVDILNKEPIKVENNIAADGQLAEELLIILDRIIIDEYIKVSPRMMTQLSEKEQVEFIINKRDEILDIMKDSPMLQKEYIKE